MTLPVLPSVKAQPACCHCPASVATSFQLGSRDVISRANVHTSVTVVTASGLPSITAPERSRVTETSCDTNRMVTCAVLFAFRRR